MKSMRRQIFGWLVMLLLLSSMIGSGLGFWINQQNMARMLDSTIAQRTQFAIGSLEVWHDAGNSGDGLQPMLAMFNRLGRPEQYGWHLAGLSDPNVPLIWGQVWVRGQCQLTLTNLPCDQAPPLTSLKSGFDFLWVGDSQWRTFSAYSVQTDIWFQLAYPAHLPRERVWASFVEFLQRFVFLWFALTLALALLGVSLGLAPLRRYVDALKQGAASTAIKPEHLPTELREIQQTLQQLEQQHDTQRQHQSAQFRAVLDKLFGCAEQLEAAVAEGELGQTRARHLTQKIARELKQSQLRLELNEPQSTGVACLVLDRQLQAAVKRISPLLHKRRLSIPPPEVTTGCDLIISEIALQILLDALLELAIRRSRPGQTLSLSCGCEGQRGWIEVADQGPALSEEALSRLLRLARHDSELVLVPQILDAYGIELRSEHHAVRQRNRLILSFARFNEGH
ncbi:hypothetical protein [Ferrimonas pelagia]|uniref:histidine kinase n=1 Tax=Ferrimonas pelagia TaxID=1177826 RepID=A0ABP9F979_9GAMM